jgi:hypothetical protein
VLEVAGEFHNVSRMPDGDWVFIRFPSLDELEDGED